MDRVSAATRSHIMSTIRGRDTLPELRLRCALITAGVRGYRKNVKGVPGTPDLVFKGLKVAVFVDGDFWHGHHWEVLEPKLTDPWRKKIARNRERDVAMTAALEGMGWCVFRFWEEELETGAKACAMRVKREVDRRRRRG